MDRSPGRAAFHNTVGHSGQRRAALVGGATLVVVAVVFAFAVYAAGASAAIVIPAGGQAVLKNGQFNACDHLTYGYVLNGGPRHPVDSSQPPQPCGTHSGPALGATIGPFGASQNLLIYLTDESCTQSPDVTYFSDGSATVSGETGPADHATATGSNPYSVAINDGGPASGGAPCVNWDTDGQPASGAGNLNVTVQINSRPAVSVTAPSPPAAQNGLFNIQDVAAAGGAIPVKVSAQDPATDVPVGIAGLSCTDNGLPVGVTNVSGRSPVTGTVLEAANGLHVISCTVSDAAGLSASNAVTVALDTTRSSLVLPSTPVVVTATQRAGTPISGYPVTVSDPDLGDAPSVACTPAAPRVFPIGDTPVTCTATDRAGNSTNGQFVLRVLKRQTSTSISCSPSTLARGKSAACTATVTDASGAVPIVPSGTICVSSDEPGVFGDGHQSCTPTGASTSCTLMDGVRTCKESFTPSSYKPGTTYTITASYSGDATYSGSARSTSVAAIPEAGVAAAVTVVSGTVYIFVKHPRSEAAGGTGAAVVGPLKGETVSVAPGSTIDAQKGVVRLSSAADYRTANDPKHTVTTGTFSVAIFTVEQLTERQALARMRIRRRRLLKMKAPTNLVLNTPAGAVAKARCRRTGHPGHLVVREFTGFAKGLYRTIAAASITTVTSAGWAVIDRCDGTVTEVGSGHATVTPRHPRHHPARGVVVGPGQRVTIKGRFL